MINEAEFDRYIRQEMDGKHLPGFAVVLQKEGKEIFKGSFGLSSIELNVPATLENIYPIASITKIFAATAVFMLIEQGKISLDDKITELLPGHCAQLS